MTILEMTKLTKMPAEPNRFTSLSDTPDGSATKRPATPSVAIPLPRYSGTISPIDVSSFPLKETQRHDQEIQRATNQIKCIINDAFRDTVRSDSPVSPYVYVSVARLLSIDVLDNLKDYMSDKKEFSEEDRASSPCSGYTQAHALISEDLSGEKKLFIADVIKAAQGHQEYESALSAKDRATRPRPGYTSEDDDRSCEHSLEDADSTKPFRLL
jgi:hypothetical protein